MQNVASNCPLLFIQLLLKTILISLGFPQKKTGSMINRILTPFIELNYLKRLNCLSAYNRKIKTLKYEENTLR